MVLLYLSDKDSDDVSKKVVDYNINENQFAIEYTAIFEDGTSDSYIVNKIIGTVQILPLWVENIIKKEKSKKEKSNKQ
ncbi:MAG TPA: hypothetical protein VHJ38_05270 [Nitrososphaeraceae archaeon]|jgi:hypothetical protein|nr:hypothetical protein [Nitrososphaeraceae archaeon]